MINDAKSEGTILNIQKFSLNDGPGIRTVVFFKGCPLRCRWCSNPESQSPETTSNYGKKMTIDEILEICRQDLAFYNESNGGVTLSGGEVLSQFLFCSELLAQLKSEGINTAIETSGFIRTETFQSILSYVDHLLIDMKHWDPVKHLSGTGVSNEVILDNIRVALYSHSDVLIRIPVIPGFNDSMDDARGFCSLLSSMKTDKVQLLPFHQFGESKYQKLGMAYDYSGIPNLHEEDLDSFRSVFISCGINAFF